MKLPITFEQFKSDPSKAIMFLLLGVVSVLYLRSESQSRQINERCEKRLTMYLEKYCAKFPEYCKPIELND